MAKILAHATELTILSPFKPLTDEDIQFYELYKKSIDEKIREAFPSIPKSFQLKPVRLCRTEGCGTFYDYKVALPDQKFATISFRIGGLTVSQSDDNENPKEQEPNFSVKPELTSTPDF